MRKEDLVLSKKMASPDIPFPNNVRVVDNNSFLNGARFGRRKRTILLLLLMAIIFFLWFNADLDRSNKDNSIGAYVPDDATGISPEKQQQQGSHNNEHSSDANVTLNDDVDVDEEEQKQLEEEEALEEEIESEKTSMNTTPASPTTTANTKQPTASPKKTSISKTTTILMQPQHFKYFIVIASRATHTSRRQLIRQTYFGLNDNVEPCMKRDKGINYMFWIYGNEPAAKTPARRAYETEKMEWNDLEKVGNTKSYHQDDVLRWVEGPLKERGVTYDYLIIQDSYSLIQLNYIQQQIQNEVGQLWQLNKTATQLLWAPAKHTQFLLAGSDAVKQGIARQKEFEDVNPKDESSSTWMTNYYEFYRSIQIQLKFVNSSKEVQSLKTLMLDAPVLISDEGKQRFMAWDNHEESIPDMAITVSNIYQDNDFRLIAKTLNLGPVSLCKPLEKSTIALLTSSFIYSDSCMEPSATLSAMNKRQYALTHNYAFVARSNEFAQQNVRSPKRRTVWGKIDAVQKVLPKYDWLFWMDMDAIVMNPDRTVQGILDELRVKYPGGPRAFEKEIDLVIARPTRDKMINAGVFFLRNTDWAQKFLNAVQASKGWYNKGPSYEQGAMWDLIQSPGYKEHVLLLNNDDHTFNTLPSRYIPGDFIVHFAPDKCPSPAVLKGLEAAERIQQGEKVTSLSDG
ncbi:MAG: galactosyl transferase GMA12/MNN10 family-domain-containing protein [Benjaminiella poitrasii]|nr:MAG: galactosyl transferase GMA12/MNN10 family-domain-containing protein [Benjaminiella poitrasii]